MMREMMVVRAYKNAAININNGFKKGFIQCLMWAPVATGFSHFLVDFLLQRKRGGGNPMGEEKRKKGRAGRTLFVGGVSCIVFLETMEMYQKCTRDLKRGEGQRSVYVKMVSCTILIDNMYI